jgi:hypothetical protein
VVGRVIAGIQDLNPGIVLAVKRRNRRGTTRCLGRRRRAKPKAEVVHLYRVERRVQARIRKRSIEHDRGWCAARRHCKRLNAEAANELPVASSILVGFDVALVPGDSKRSFGDLDDKEVELGVGRQVSFS